jgi:transposase
MKWVVDLPTQERLQLVGLVCRGRSSVRRVRRARMLLLTDEGKKDAAIAEHLHVTVATVRRVRWKYAREGLASALGEGYRPGAPRKLTSVHEEQLRSILRTPPPAGRKHWSLQSLAERLVESGAVESISSPTVHNTLRRLGLQPHIQ